MHSFIYLFILKSFWVLHRNGVERENDGMRMRGWEGFYERIEGYRLLDVRAASIQEISMKTQPSQTCDLLSLFCQFNNFADKWRKRSWDEEIMRSWDHEIRRSWDHEIMGSWDHEIMGSGDHGIRTQPIRTLTDMKTWSRLTGWEAFSRVASAARPAAGHVGRGSAVGAWMFCWSVWTLDLLLIG